MGYWLQLPTWRKNRLWFYKTLWWSGLNNVLVFKQVTQVPSTSEALWEAEAFAGPAKALFPLGTSSPTLGCLLTEGHVGFKTSLGVSSLLKNRFSSFYLVLSQLDTLGGPSNAVGLLSGPRAVWLRPRRTNPTSRTSCFLRKTDFSMDSSLFLSSKMRLR